MRKPKGWIVIGAGLAGLAAAYRLELKHYQFHLTLLEARDRSS